MAHVYASLAQLNDHIRDDGSVKFASEASTIRNRKRAILEAVSRDLEGFCMRSSFGSGFGPRTGTNRYSGDGGSTLDLNDDLLSITSLTTKGSLGASGTTHTEETDFITFPFDRTPKRRIYGRGTTGSMVFPWGLRTVEIVGSWGYADDRTTATATTSAIASTTTTSITVSDAAEFSPAQTIRIDSEQMHVTGVSGTTLTVERGANGTTAATHAAAAAIDIYRYHPDVHLACLEISLLRWKLSTSGADGSDGGGEMPLQRPTAEKSILWTRLRDLRYELVR